MQDPNNINVDIFNEAQTMIFRLMASDTFKRFRKDLRNSEHAHRPVSPRASRPLGRAPSAISMSHVQSVNVLKEEEEVAWLELQSRTASMVRQGVLTRGSGPFGQPL